MPDVEIVAQPSCRQGQLASGLQSGELFVGELRQMLNSKTLGPLAETGIAERLGGKGRRIKARLFSGILLGFRAFGRLLY